MHHGTRLSAGKLIRNRRTELGLTLKDLGRTLGVSRQSLSQIELGKTNLSTKRGASRMKLVARALKLDPDDLLITRSTRKMRRGVTRSPMGRLIAKCRMRAFLTQPEVAKELGVTKVMLARIELGRKIPTPDQIVALERILGCKIPFGFCKLPGQSHAQLPTDTAHGSNNKADH